jgi:hypothetical protein
MKYLVEGQNLDDILKDFGGFWRKLTSESQLRWVSFILRKFVMERKFSG